MRQYEFAIRIAQIHHLVEERKYKKALAVIRTLDMRQVKSISDLTIIADVFARTEQFDSAKEAYLKIYNKSKTRRVVYRLISISIRTKELDDAERYYNEFVQMGFTMPKPQQYILTFPPAFLKPSCFIIQPRKLISPFFYIFFFL